MHYSKLVSICLLRYHWEYFFLEPAAFFAASALAANCLSLDVLCSFLLWTDPRQTRTSLGNAELRPNVHFLYQFLMSDCLNLTEVYIPMHAPLHAAGLYIYAPPLDDVSDKAIYSAEWLGRHANDDGGFGSIYVRQRNYAPISSCCEHVDCRSGNLLAPASFLNWREKKMILT